MRRLLVIGDTHIPDRAPEVPRRLLEVIEKESPYDVVVFTGDLTAPSVLRWVESLAPQCYVVCGNMDYLDLPEEQRFEIDGVAYGVVHGHQVFPRGDIKRLTSIAMKMKVKVLFSGHTHRPFARSHAGVIHVNPGSLTGVWGGGGGSMKPSMIVIDVHRSLLRGRLYELGPEGLTCSEFEAQLFS